jgi:asparagine synthase (glutamine-hydrolysing)
MASEVHRTQSDTPFKAITAKSLSPEKDESQYAKMVVDQYGIDWYTINPTVADFASEIDKVIYYQEEPFGTPSVVMQYFVMKKAREVGCIVMLDGQGGDETNLGYERYFTSYLKSLSPYHAIKAYFNISNNSKLTLKDTLFYSVYFSNSLIRKKRLRYKNSFVSDTLFDAINWKPIKLMAAAQKDITQLQKIEIESTCLPHLLKYEDRNAMSHSVEARVPFIDHELVEMVLSVPPSFKIKNGWTKNLIREASSGFLPDEVRWRKVKFGFESPDKIWLKDKAYFDNVISQSAILNKIIDIKPSITENLINRWKLYNIARWEKMFEVNI